MPALSLPLSPRRGLTTLSAASVRYAIDGASASVRALLRTPVAADADGGAPLERARAIDHDQPIANSRITRNDATLKIRSPRWLMPFAQRRAPSLCGNASTSTGMVDHASSMVEL